MITARLDIVTSKMMRKEFVLTWRMFVIYCDSMIVEINEKERRLLVQQETKRGLQGLRSR